MNYVEIEFLGQKCRVPALKAQGRLWFHWRGQTHVVELDGATRRAAGAKGSARPGVIAAPMPGKVTRVAVAPGAAVTKGQTLVVMEAMKMEYTLEADLAGRVSEVTAQVGAQVGLGDILVRVEAAGG